ncbi:hypothetical protein [Streptomyces fradiae]|uniref:hypothetical protein n=1 Tax=Streptomyces fradiae TaxID=1906 RepID=UPI0035147900
MRQETNGRKFSARTLIVIAACLAVLGGIGAWLLFGRETAEPCNGVPGNERVQKSMGKAVQPDMSCAAFGEALVKATVGDKPGHHTQQQAQALKDVLFALGFTQPDDFTLDPALRLPLATALADYAPDVHETLAGLDSKYIVESDQEDPPWESGGTYHLAVYNTFFRDILRAISENPDAYALLRVVETRQVAQELDAVPSDAKDAAFRFPPKKGARALGVLDGVASVVVKHQDEDEARTWRTTVVDALTRGLGTPVEVKESPSGRLTSAWLRDFEKTGEEERFDRLSDQGVDLARIWLKSRNTDATTQQGLLAEVADSALGGSREVTW